MPSRLRSPLAWIPAVLVVPLALVGSIRLSEQDTDQSPLLDLQPFDVGTTWVYDVFDHGEPSGTHTKQVTSGAGVDFERLDGVAVTGRYSDYPGRGELSNITYLSADDTTMYQDGLRQDGELLDLEPAAPTYELPLEEGESWSYEGTFGSATLSFEASIEAIGPVEVSGREFAGCLHVVTELSFTFESGAGDPETVEEWACPGYGTVRTIDTIPAQDVEITEELTAFHGPEADWVSDGSRAAAGSVTADPAPGDTLGFDAARTRSVPDGSLQETLAWADLRSQDIAYPPVSDGDATVLVEEDGLVTGMDAGSGVMRWRQQVARPPVAPVALGGGLALVADGRKDLWALGTDDGTARWVHHFDDVVSASPVVVGREVVVVTDDGAVSALDLADGHVVWERDLGARVRSAPALTDDAVVVADISGAVTALDTESGDTRWSHALEGGMTAGPAVGDGLVLVADDVNVVYALDTDDGSVSWQTRTNRDIGGDFALAADAAVLGDGGDYLESFALADGHRSWSRRIDPTSESPVVVGEEVLTVSDRGRVSVRALEDGRETRSWPLPRPHPETAPAVDVPLGLVGGNVVVGAELTGDGVQTGLFAYPTAPPDPDALAGTSFGIETRLVPSPPAGPPTLIGDTLLVPGGDQTLYRSTGRSDFDEVVTSKALLPSVSSDGDLVVVHVDDEVRGYPLAGGDQLWRFPAAQPFVAAVPTIAGDRVFVPEYGLGLAAASTDGDPLWFTPLDNAFGTGSPVPLPGGDVFWGVGGAARFDRDTGDRVWGVPDTQTYANAAYDDGTVFAEIVRNTHPSGLAAIDAGTGRVRWVQENANTAFFVGPAAADGVVVHGDSLGLVVARDGRTGEELWRARLTSPLAGAPAIIDGRVYLTEQGRTEDLFQRDYRLSVHDLHTGRFLGAYQPPSSTFAGSPSVTASADGRLVLPIGRSVANAAELSPFLILEPGDE